MGLEDGCGGKVAKYASGCYSVALAIVIGVRDQVIIVWVKAPGVGNASYHGD